MQNSNQLSTLTEISVKRKTRDSTWVHIMEICGDTGKGKTRKSNKRKSNRKPISKGCVV